MIQAMCAAAIPQPISSAMQSRNLACRPPSMSSSRISQSRMWTTVTILLPPPLTYLPSATSCRNSVDYRPQGPATWVYHHTDYTSSTLCRLRATRACLYTVCTLSTSYRLRATRACHTGYSLPTPCRLRAIRACHNETIPQLLATPRGTTRCRQSVDYRPQGPATNYAHMGLPPH
eukprot:gene17354-biopygen17325